MSNVNVVAFYYSLLDDWYLLHKDSEAYRRRIWSAMREELIHAVQIIKMKEKYEQSFWARRRYNRGPILWQLPGTLEKDLGRLAGFLRTLNRQVRHAIEFRHPSWLDKAVFDLLRRHRIANVTLSSRTMPMCLEITTDFVYVRFHGLEGGAAHNYSDRELRPWAKFLRQCAKEGVPGFVYFNNDMNTRAPLNALRLMELVGPLAAPCPGPQ